MTSPYYIYQVHHNDCGPAAIKMLCAQLYQSESFLFYEEKWPRPMSVKAMIEAANELGITLKGYKLHHPSSIRGVKQPMIVLRYTPNPHFVTVFPKAKHRFLILDPSQAPQMVSDTYFLQGFSGVIVVLKHFPNIPVVASKFKAVVYPGFVGWSLTLFFFVSAFIWLTLDQPAWWVGLLVGLLGIGGWLYDLVSRYRRLDQWMQHSAYHYITNTDQYHRYHVFKQGWLLVPLKQFYRRWVIMTMVMYIGIANPGFLIPLGLHVLVMTLVATPRGRHLKQLSQTLDEQEKNLKYPLLNIQPLVTIHTMTARILIYWWQTYGIMLGLALIFMIGYQQWFPYQDFLTFITGITVMMIVSNQSLKLHEDKLEKQAWRQEGYLFLNQHNYGKINS